MSYKDYLKSGHWKDTKNYLQIIDGGKECWVCATKDKIQTHHLHYKSLGYEDGDELIFLCAEHHLKVTFIDTQRKIKRPFETDKDLALACRKLQSMRSKLHRNLPNDKIARIANNFN